MVEPTANSVSTKPEENLDGELKVIYLTKDDIIKQ